MQNYRTVSKRKLGSDCSQCSGIAAKSMTEVENAEKNSWLQKKGTGVEKTMHKIVKNDDTWQQKFAVESWIYIILRATIDVT